MDRWDDWVELRRRRRGRTASAPPALLADPHHLLQLRGRLRPARLRRQGRPATIAQARGQPRAPRPAAGRNCAKGPATLNQVNDPDRILYPLKRGRPRGARAGGSASPGTRRSTTSAAASAPRIREGRRDEVMYHVGRPGEDGYIERVLHAWGVDGHNSHTNICSSGARARLRARGWASTGPSPDHANAKVIFLISSHLEAGHYFNPHAQRIIEGKQSGREGHRASTRACPTRRPCRPLAAAPGRAPRPRSCWRIARLLLEAGTLGPRVRPPLGQLGDVPRRDRDPTCRCTFESVRTGAARRSTPTTRPERAAELCGLDAGADPRDRPAHRRRARARSRPTPGGPPAAGNLGGWQVARCLFSSTCSPARSAREGGTCPNGWNKFIPVPPKPPHPHDQWNDLHVAGRVPARPPRDVVPAAALPQGGPRPARHLLHPRLQPGLDQPRRVLAGSRC